MYADLPWPLHGELPEDMHCLSCSPIDPQQQVQDLTTGAQKTCLMHKGMNISSDSRLATIEDTSSGPLHMLFPLCFQSVPPAVCIANSQT